MFKKNFRKSGLRERIHLLREFQQSDCSTSLPTSAFLKLLEIPSSSYYYSLKHNPEKQEILYQKKYQGLRKKVDRIIKKHPSYGYRRIKEALSKQGIEINHKPLRKLLKIWHLQHRKKRKVPKPSPLSQYLRDLGIKANLVRNITNPKPLQIIFTDFTEIPFLFGKARLILFIDSVSKRIVGWNLDQYATARNALQGWQKVRRYLRRMKIDFSSVIVHQDQGSAFTSYEYIGTLLNDNVSLSFTSRGFEDNREMESCIGHFKEEYKFLILEAEDLKEAKKIVGRCIKDWNKDRIHSSLKGRSPDEFIHTYFKLSKS